MSGSKFIGLIAGVVVGGAVALFGGGAFLVLAAFATTAQVVSYYLGPRGGFSPASSPGSLSRPTNNSGREAAAQAFQTASSSEAIGIPVLFGRNKIAGNYLRADKSTFSATPIIERIRIEQPIVQQSITVQQSGGKGGGGGGDQASPQSGARRQPQKERIEERIVGYRYRLSWDYMLSMGEIDAVHAAHSSPGNIQVLKSQVDEGDSFLLTLAGPEEGGTVRVYRGSKSQTREPGEVYTDAVSNYRHVCFASFQNFLMGTQPAPKTYVFVVTRMPRPLAADGNQIVTIRARGGEQFILVDIVPDGTKWVVTVGAGPAHTFKIGDEVRVEGNSVAAYNGIEVVSAVPSGTTFEVVSSVSSGTGTAGTVHHLSYEDANPAAILWEAATNKIWGRGEKHSLFHQASFEQASDYFRNHNIGMSFHLETQDFFGDIVESIQTHVNTHLIWDGRQVRCIVLDDRDTAYSPRRVLDSDTLQDLQLTRPTWAGTINELKAEFTNRENNYQKEIIPVQDMAAAFTTGKINSVKIAVNGFAIRSVAEPQVRRILYGMSYPVASLSFRMNRFESRMIPGDFVQVNWIEFSDATARTFWRILSIDDSGQEDEGFAVVLTEDRYAVPYEGDEILPFVAPVPFTDFDTGTASPLLSLGDDRGTHDPAGELSPQRIDDLNIFVTGGVDAAALGLDRENLGLVGVALAWKLTTESGSLWKDIGFYAPWVTAGTLKTTIPIGIRDADRSLTFDFEIERSANATAMLASANKVVIDGDDLAVLTAANTDMIRIGNETMLVGSIVDTGGGLFRASNVMRGMYGTLRETHAVDDTLAYVESYQATRYQVPRGGIPVDTVVDFRAIPFSSRGAFEDSDATLFTGTISGLGSDGFAPALFTVDKATDTWTLKLRPRWHLTGSGTLSDFQTIMSERVTEIQEGYAWWVEPFLAAASQGSRELLTVTFVADDGVTALAGLLDTVYTAPAGTDELRIHTAVAGKQATAFLSIPAP